MSSLTHARVISFGVIAYIVAFVCRKNWYLRSAIKREEYGIYANYTVVDVPTTFYDADGINDVLKGWYKETDLKHGPDGNYFQLFRVKPGQNKVFNYKNLNSMTQAMELKSTCEYPESALCSPCFDHEAQRTVHTDEIFKPKGNGPGLYSSFAKLEDIPSVQGLFDFVNVTGMNFNEVALEHAFLSNLKEPMVTAQIHANGLTSSMAVQFVGEKSWVFFPPKVFRGQDMLDGMPGSGTIYPHQSPKKAYEIYHYVSQPGDILFFSENWGHIVETRAGPNIMMNFRKFEFGNFYRQPLDFLHDFVNAMIFRPQKTNGRKRTQYNKIQTHFLGLAEGLCGPDFITPWDAEMVKVLRGKKHNSAY